MNEPLSQSYEACRQVARASASSFYFAFRLLPAEKRRAMHALYAFLRHTDDLADDPPANCTIHAAAGTASAAACDEQPAALEVRRAALAEWRGQLAAALAGRGPHSAVRDPCLPDPTLAALADTVARYRIDPALLYTVIDGVESDLQPTHFATFDELDRYCYQVATAVGLACLPIWGCHPSLDPRLVHQCGLAYQLTNILRDLKEDLTLGRLYLPADELARFDLSIEDLRREVRDQRFERLMAWQVDRAARCFAEGRRLVQWLEPDGQRIFTAMTDTYEALLDQIRQRQFDVFSARVRLTRRAKWQIWLRALWLRPVPIPTSGKY